MLSTARQKKIMEKLNRAQKGSILGPQNLGSRGGPGPPGSAPENISSFSTKIKHSWYGAPGAQKLDSFHPKMQCVRGMYHRRQSSF